MDQKILRSKSNYITSSYFLRPCICSSETVPQVIVSYLSLLRPNNSSSMQMSSSDPASLMFALNTELCARYSVARGMARHIIVRKRCQRNSGRFALKQR